jgi:hypothetical protein
MTIFQHLKLRVQGWFELGEVRRVVRRNRKSSVLTEGKAKETAPSLGLGAR